MPARPGLAILLAAAVLFPAAAADWPSFHNDEKNTGSVFGSSYPVFQEVWWNNKTLANAQIKASPVLKDNVLIVADTAGLVRALDASSGKQLWYYKMPAGVEGTPAISGERVYVVSKDGTLNALSLHPPQVTPTATPAPGAPSGVVGVVEHTAMVGPTLGSITVKEGSKLFIGTEAGEMRAYLASTLTLLWTFRVDSVFHSSTTTTLGTVCGGGQLSALPIRGAPAVFDGKVYFGSMNGAVFAVNEAGGQGTMPNGQQLPATQTNVMWVYETGDVVLGSPAINTREGQVNRVVFTSYDGKAYSFDASPGGAGNNPCYGHKHTPAWTYQVPTIKDPNTGETQVSKIESSPASAGSRIVFGANNGRVYAVDSSSGSLLWETVAGDDKRPVTSSPAVANGKVVIGSQDKHVYWINATDGKVLRRFATEGAVLTSPAIDGNHAFAASQNGVLYNFGPEIPTRADLAVTAISSADVVLKVTVANQGDREAGNTTLRLFVGGTFLANVEVPKLAPAATVTIDHPTTLSGSHAIRAVVDPDNRVAESNDSNNEMQQAVTLGAVTPPPGDGGGNGGDGGDGGGIKIPGPGLPALLAGVLAAALLAARRRLR